jgi:hypothetical protein
MIISIFSKEKAEGLSAYIILPHAIISIGEPKPWREDYTGPAKFADNEKRLGVLRLEFYDIDMLSITNAGYKHDIQESGGKGLFTDEQAVQVVNFVDEMKGKIEVLVCHCEGGVSRSSGMGAAISLMVNGSDEKIFNNIEYIPNMFVYRKVLDAWQERNLS